MNLYTPANERTIAAVEPVLIAVITGPVLTTIDKWLL